MNEWDSFSEMKAKIENEEIDEEDRENNARLLRRQYPWQIISHCESMADWRKMKRFDGPAQHDDNGDDEEVERN